MSTEALAAAIERLAAAQERANEIAGEAAKTFAAMNECVGNIADEFERIGTAMTRSASTAAAALEFERFGTKG
jgi:hypothetical protein